MALGRLRSLSGEAWELAAPKVADQPKNTTHSINIYLSFVQLVNTGWADSLPKIELRKILKEDALPVTLPIVPSRQKRFSESNSTQLLFSAR